MPAFQSSLGASLGVGEANFIIVIVTNNITGTGSDNVVVIDITRVRFIHIARCQGEAANIYLCL